MKKFIGILEALYVLISVFVLGSAGGRIPLLPESYDKNVSFSVSCQLHKNIFFLRKDYVFCDV